MNKLLFFLLLIAVEAGAAFRPVGPGGGAYSKTVFVNHSGNSLLSGLALTNAGTRAAAGTLVYVAPGTYWIGTNAQSILGRGVDMYLSPGAILTMGTAADASSDNALFEDAYDGLGARTNRVFGYGEIYVSNLLGRVCLSTDGNSKWFIQCKSARTLGTGTSFQLDAGGMDIWANDYLQSDQYDIVTTGSTAPQYLYVNTRRAFAGDSIIELGSSMTNFGDAVITIDYAEALASGGAFGSGALAIGGNSVFNISSLVFKRGAASIYGTITNQNDSGSGVLQNCTIVSLPAATVSTIQRPSATYGTAFKLRNCTIIGPTSRDPIEANPMAGKLTVQDCTIVSGASATNWVRPSAAGNCNVRLYGDLNVNFTNHAGITIIGKSYTTNDAATVNN